jgi:hypothetical protein
MLMCPLVAGALRAGEAAEAMGREKEELAAEKEAFQKEKEVCMCGWISWGVMRWGLLDVWVVGGCVRMKEVRDSLCCDGAL